MRGIWWNIFLPIEHKWAQAKCKKKSARMRNRYFVRTQYGVIKIKSLSYSIRSTIILPNSYFTY
ncbi:hypothetical protein [Arsenophonus endosymbiont of Bemisia tabaci]|uniref:hypothetical protein n=1 Tax=Arsenophonus endosymbiont of Bemisia tabaci TaxID=536059 RepID=UPI0015F3C445|nr:hypothetical protein [Arsenophonus endosymbiont of Bemisia tabaci]